MKTLVAVIDISSVCLSQTGEALGERPAIDPDLVCGEKHKITRYHAFEDSQKIAANCNRNLAVNLQISPQRLGYFSRLRYAFVTTSGEAKQVRLADVLR